MTAPRWTAGVADTIHLRLTADQASVLLDIIADLEVALWNVFEDHFVDQAQAESQLEAYEEDIAEEQTHMEPDADSLSVRRR